MSLALATNSAAFEQKVRRAFTGSLNGELARWRGDLGTADLQAVIADLTELGAEVVAVGPDIDFESALALARELDDSHPEISVVVVTEPTPEVWEAALRAGVRDVLPSEFAEEELRLVLERAMEISDRRRRNLTDAGGATGAAGRVLTVVAPKGGSGKTAIATNLGVGLAQAAPGKVALVDLDLQFGDVTGTLELDPEHSIADFMATPGARNLTALKVFLTTRREELYVLCAPDEPERGEQIGEGIVRRAIDLLAKEFPYVIIDTAAGLTEHTLTAVELATDLILVCDLSAAAVRGMRKVTGALDQLGFTRAKRHFVLNRADSKVGVELAEVAAMVGMPIDIKLPSSRAVAASMNAGIPLIESAPRSPYGRRMTELTNRFLAAPVKPVRQFPWKRRDQ